MIVYSISVCFFYSTCIPLLKMSRHDNVKICNTLFSKKSMSYKWSFQAKYSDIIKLKRKLEGVTNFSNMILLSSVVQVIEFHGNGENEHDEVMNHY